MRVTQRYIQISFSQILMAGSMHSPAEGVENQWITFIAEILPLLSIGLSDIMNCSACYIALRAMLVSGRTVGALEVLCGSETL